LNYSFGPEWEWATDNEEENEGTNNKKSKRGEGEEKTNNKKKRGRKPKKLSKSEMRKKNHEMKRRRERRKMHSEKEKEVAIALRGRSKDIIPKNMFKLLLNDITGRFVGFKSNGQSNFKWTESAVEAILVGVECELTELFEKMGWATENSKRVTVTEKDMKLILCVGEK